MLVVETKYKNIKNMNAIIKFLSQYQKKNIYPITNIQHVPRLPCAYKHPKS